MIQFVDSLQTYPSILNGREWLNKETKLRPVLLFSAFPSLDIRSLSKAGLRRMDSTCSLAPERRQRLAGMLLYSSHRNRLWIGFWLRKKSPVQPLIRISWASSRFHLEWAFASFSFLLVLSFYSWLDREHIWNQSKALVPPLGWNDSVSLAGMFRPEVHWLKGRTATY